MHLLVLLVLLPCISIVQGDCSDHKNCVKCANSNSSTPFSKCRWCDISWTCHALGSYNNICERCNEGSRSPKCFVNDAAKCLDKPKRSGDFNPHEAYNATLYSAIAYTDDPVRCAKTLFSDGTFEVLEVIRQKCGHHLFDYNECQAVLGISHQLRLIVLTYRGTSSTSQLVQEVLSVVVENEVPQVYGKAQEYFSNASDQLYTCVSRSLRAVVKKHPNYKVMITGHSLGASIASIASAKLSYENVTDKEKTVLYTFGMPRTGDFEYAIHHDMLVPKSWRLVHDRDPVPCLPPQTGAKTGPFHHQLEIFYRREMSVSKNYMECLKYEDENCRNSLPLSLLDVGDHKVYYNISVGSHCDSMMGRRRKISDENSDLSHFFNFTLALPCMERN